MVVASHPVQDDVAEGAHRFFSQGWEAAPLPSPRGTRSPSRMCWTRPWHPSEVVNSNADMLIDAIPDRATTISCDKARAELGWNPVGIAEGMQRYADLMRRGSFFVNTARGRLVDEDALMAALHSRHLAGTALDVFWWEPILPDNPLRSTPNLLMTPHNAGTPAGETVALELGSAGRVIRRRNGAMR